MRLKSMDIFGFKSFAEKTKVIFEPGITIIVGPNGCGKSNIVDAMKWVLGEKQARNIRGEKMEDIIFTGTEQRKPLSLSEVSISFDNSNRTLDMDSDTVMVTRRVFRDGDSEYLINKSPVRLKDIEKLFMDTGVGKTSYSVMEQGKIDMILSSRAEDRRYIFEEAAGISRYKMQRKESLRKLQETGENLARINDIIKEIEREKDLKAKQAKKTEKYLELKTGLNELDIQYNIIRYCDHTARKEKLTSDLGTLKKKREEISARISRISTENERDEQEKNDVQLFLFEQDKELHTYNYKVNDIDSKTAKNRELIQEQELRRRNIEKNIKERNEGLERINADRKKSEQAGIDISGRIDNDRGRLEKFIATRKRKIETIQQARQQIGVNKNDIKSCEERVKKLRELVEEVVKRLVDAIEKRKAELQESEAERQDVRHRIEQFLSDFSQYIEEAIKHLDSGNNVEAATVLRKIEFTSLQEEIHTFEGFEDGFRSILFDKSGIHAEKEALDGNIVKEMKRIDELNAEIVELDERIVNEEYELEDVNGMITGLEKDLSRNETERDWIEKHIKNLDIQILDIKKQIGHFEEELEHSLSIDTTLRSEIEQWEQELLDFNEKSESLKKSILEQTEKREEISSRISNRKEVSLVDMEQLEKIVEKISTFDRSMVEIDFKISTIAEYLWNEYEKKVDQLEPIKAAQFDSSNIQQKMLEFKREIQGLGPINNLAIEEYKDLTKRFKYYFDQRKDIQKAREDIVSVMKDILNTSLEMFIKAFRGIQKNFTNIFKQLFEGGNASIELVDEENILESGIDILVRPPGKKLKNIRLLSGGERALTAIALLFAIYMERPSPFCFLDEIDAPLDEENIGRFVKLLREFAKGTQFIIVTHNKKTMSTGESIYGITMEEPGVSRVVSLRMEKSEKKVV